MKNVCLFGKTVFAEKLTYTEACSFLEKAVHHARAEDYSFSIEGKPGEDGWRLCGEHKDLRAAFINNPEIHVLTIEEEKHEE